MLNGRNAGRGEKFASLAHSRSTLGLALRSLRSQSWQLLVSSHGNRSHAATRGFDQDRLGQMFRVALIVGSDGFSAYAASLATALEGLDVDVTVHRLDDAIPTGEAAVLIGLHRFTLSRVRALHRTRTVAAIQTEQLATPMQGAPQFGTHKLPITLRALPHLDVVVDWSRENARLLRAHHPRVAVVPFALIEADLYQAVDTVTPSYDLAFIGHVDALDGRRRKILSQLAANFTVHPTVHGAWGPDKFAVFTDARIVLNLHVEASAVFESPRFYDVLGARRPLLSEPVHDPWPFLPGRDFQEATVLDLERQVRRLLEDAPQRERLAASGRATAEANSMDVSAATLLRLLLVAYHR